MKQTSGETFISIVTKRWVIKNVDSTQSTVVHSTKQSVRPTIPALLYQYKEYTLSEDNISTLQRGQWLDDQIINTYIAMVADDTSHVCALSTYAYVMMERHGLTTARSMYATVLASPDHELILMPIHEPGHWTLVVVSKTQRAIVYYNSLSSSNDNMLRTVKLFFEDVYGGVWTTSTAQNIPQQTGGSDCGVFVCRYAELISRGEELNFRQVDMRKYREYILKRIERQCQKI